MSFSCSKEFSLHVDPAGPPILRAYYKCEDASGMTWVDEIGDNDLIVQSGSGFNSTTGIVNNGLTVGPTSDIATTNNAYDPAFNLGGGSFTVRFWYHTPDNTESGGVILFDLTASGGAKECSIVHYLPDELEWNVNSVGHYWDGDDGLKIVGVPTGQWNRLIIWYESGIGFGMKLNNGSDVLIADVTGFPVADRYLFIRLDNLPSIPGKFDEIGVWAKKWSAAEMLYDWNGGAGKTYPDVPDAP